MSGFDISKYREMFVEEAVELFESADNVLLEAETNGTLTDEQMGQLFRDVHTLKGSGASVELNFFAEFTHDVENMMDKLRNHEIEFKPEMAGTLIDGLDVMRELLDLEVAEDLDRDTFEDMTTSLLKDIRAYINAEEVSSTNEASNTTQASQVETPTENIKKEVDDESLTDNIGFFEDNLNEQRDHKTYGIFADDDLDEENTPYGFFDDDLNETAKLSMDDNSSQSIYEDDEENFGFFDEMPAITPDAELKTNDVKQEVKKKNQLNLKIKKK